MNGPLEGFVRTLPRQNPTPEDRPDVYALDCEMGFTVRGLELLKVTVITQDGSVKYESLVRPEAEIVDYNTRFSGVKEEDYRGNFKTLREVHSDLTEFIKEDTILIGHGLENDLRALRMVHSSCVDTAVVFPHRRGLPFHRALRDLVMYVLGRSIQDNPEDHDSTEDARASLDLLSSEQCAYHWGRLYPNPSCPSYYLCCEGIPSSQGCSTCRRHVWSGISTGMNGPLEGFVRTLPRQNPTPEDRPDVYALDCEMGFTVRGLELLKVTVITQDGSNF
ncbi:nucleic acid binding [Homalodisca vitripennis]|nr:nucleic acid binding [Homalodisca vitripennis]